MAEKSAVLVVSLAAGEGTVDVVHRLAERRDDAADIGFRPLPALDLEGVDAGVDEFGQELREVEADRLLEGVVAFGPVRRNG